MIDEDLNARMIAWRRHLHAHPEVATTEARTADFVAAELSGLGIEFERGVGGHGIVATLTRPGSARCIGLRADMDALPIHEETGLPHASQTAGVMHACGHDGHTASLLGAANLLAADPSWSGTVRLVFQPAEEGAIGARAMIEDGFFERFPMDAIFAYHNWPGLPAGEISAVPGPIMAAGGRIGIKLLGTASHAAMPHRSRDALLAAGHLLTALQSIASRMVDPLEAAVVSITTLQTGLAFNQVADRVTLGGTMRTLKPEVRDRVEEEIVRISEGIAATFGMKAEVNLRRSAPATVNDPKATQLAARAAEVIGATVHSATPPSLAGEDFAFLLERIPGAMVWIGNGPLEGGRELHSPRYDFNDDILPVAARWLHEVAKQGLRDNQPVNHTARP
ncbi:amidohydrolase [Seohaeicola zhoushanensis]|uniref:Amidohydrolase n=1 Tax=Seohaeicola zhoushanensis TaxID=1569283 RepID=A0A8J3GZ50_9RHOB|nr:amidohydrolase [Seohaeicola zhoushanensis]GHF55636.1 amidohydrolase [Seohaeicola zhoushanensis]